ncbi:phage portal protein [Cereibacter azotoformans]|uniref:phage portal protein n=1 Tax=Cereibacter azotoformans TaxID=43057 RepID=UPI000E358F6E|nr:phage portal protein [Cereibacter azotoformans]AXQ93196.1 phage portal protein [Cereibacter sphaeroides]UIJ31507.1 phage portal protein [Cereibacter azotoformans]
MGLFDFFRSEPQATRSEPPVVAQASGDVQSPSQWHGFVTGGVSRSGVRVSETTALSIPATLQAIRVLSGVFAMTPLHYFRRTGDGRERVSDDIAALLHDRPNSHQTAFAFRELLKMDLLLSGNFYAYVSRDFAGRPKALTRLKPGSVLIAEYFDRSEGVTLFYDATLPDGSRERFPARDIWHIAGMSRDGLAGLNPIQFARDAIGGAIATADHAAKFWGNGGRPSTLLKTKHKVDPIARKQIKSDWKAIYGGPFGDDIAVLDQELEAQFLSHDNKASQYLETRGFQVMDLARLWGVPPHLIFDLSRATFSNIEQQSLEFIVFHLGPHYERVSQSATRQFAADAYYFEHVTDALVKGDVKSRMEAYWLQRQMGMVNANELRRRDNLAPIEGGAGEEYWRPGNMTLAGTPPAQQAPQAAVET